MESTGVYWKPIFNLLEGDFTVCVFRAKVAINSTPKLPLIP